VPSERVIWGPPGTGKTVACTTLCRDWFSKGTAADQIAYLAFTKAAAKAASTKIFETEDEARMSEEFPYFRTVHSLCYRALKKERPDLRLINTSDMKQFAKLYSMEGVYAVHPWEDLADVYAGMKDGGRSEWDQALSAYSFSRIKARTAEDLDRAKEEPSSEGKMMLGLDSMSLDVYQTFVRKYEKFKREDGLIDFTDMLEFGAREMKPIDDVRYVVLDEAQDLAEVHHLIVDRIFDSAQEIWWCGDDDQAIFKFSGASAELFLERARRAQHQVQLRQTYRFGQSIVDFSRQIIERVKNRHPKEILGVDGREGKLIISGSFEPIPGDVMILHRHVQGCQNVAQAYIDAGLPFRNERGRDPLDAHKRIKAWHAVRELSSGNEISMTAAALVVEDLLPAMIVGQNLQKIRLVVHGRKSALDELGRGSVSLRDLVVGNILTEEGAAIVRDRAYESMRHSNDLDYYERVAKNGYTVDVDPDERIPRITTIHGSKGRQAKHTIVFNEMGQKCWEDFETEHRLAYVAATRTQTDVTICMENKVHWAEGTYEYPVAPGVSVSGEVS
jgi:superfamily I DNA/RNA helicase